MSLPVNIDARHGFRPRRIKVEKRDGTIVDSDTSKILEKIIREQGLEADVRDDWWAINRRCSFCGKKIGKATASRALEQGTRPRCKACWLKQRKPTAIACHRCGGEVDVSTQADARRSGRGVVTCLRCKKLPAEAWVCGCGARVSHSAIMNARRRGGPARCRVCAKADIRIDVANACACGKKVHRSTALRAKRKGLPVRCRACWEASCTSK